MLVRIWWVNNAPRGGTAWMVTADGKSYYFQHVHCEVPCRTKQRRDLRPNEPPLPPEHASIRGWLEAEGQLVVAGDIGQVIPL